MPPTPPANPREPFDPDRFIAAQEHSFPDALRELRNGRKETHWMWYIFPQLDGLGSSSTARHYALQNLAAARAYLQHSVLGPRLLDCCRALLAVRDRSAAQIFGYPDDLKLRSSMTLFSLVPEPPPEFGQVLERYFEAKLDSRTMELLKKGRENR